MHVVCTVHRTTTTTAIVNKTSAAPGGAVNPNAFARGSVCVGGWVCA